VRYGLLVTALLAAIERSLETGQPTPVTTEG
jgi:hypothetical protein